MELTTLIVNYNTANLLSESIDALREAASGLQMQIIIIDNASRDDSVALIQREFSDCELIFNDKNIGFGRANNQGIPLAQGRYVLLLNTDAFVSSDTLKKTIEHMDSNPRCGVLGVKLVGRDGELQPSCRYFPTPRNTFLHRTGLQRFFKGIKMVDDMAWDHSTVRQCDWVPGCYYLIRREVIDQIGLFDPRYFLYYEEVDHCFAAKKAGWEVHYFPDTTVVHIGGESAKSQGELTAKGRQLEGLQIESELLYFCKNHGFVAAFTNVLLHTLADLINAVKQILKRNNLSFMQCYFRHSMLVWSLYAKTRFASTPTR
jgi:N-acetylglucosaminyl-diphospho-decaprenol L-rhamnosyltransferase